MDIQKILYEKANRNGYRCWIPENRGRIKTYSLKKEKTIMAFDDVIEEAQFLDCIWFKGDKEIAAIFKVCYSGKAIESLYRLMNFKEALPLYFVNYYLIIEDRTEHEILCELRKPIFKSLDISFIYLSQLNSFKLVVVLPDLLLKN